MFAELLKSINQLIDLKQVSFNVDIAYETPIDVHGDRKRIKGVLGSFMKLAVSQVKTHSQIQLKCNNSNVSTQNDQINLSLSIIW